jgi:plastocyanin
MKNSLYSVTAIEAKAGRFAVHLVNHDDSVRHDMVVGDALGHRFARSDRVEPGHDLVFTIDDLPPGTYNFWCSVGVHASSGMRGILTVTGA